MRLQVESTLSFVAAALLGTFALVPARARSFRELDALEARTAHGYACQLCTVDLGQDCTGLVATPCVLASICTRCTLGTQPAYCAFSINPFDTCSDLGATAICGQEELGACNPATGVCTFLGTFLGACAKIANCI